MRGVTQGPRLDLHIHTRASPDSSLEVEEAVKQALVQGLEGIAITDHNTMDALPAAKEAVKGTPGFLLIPGVEISTQEGHLLAYGVSKVPAPHRPIRDTVGEVLAMGGVPVLAHPYRWAHGAGDQAARQLPVLGIETMNGRNAELPNAKAGLVAAQRRLSGTGGSDAHEAKSVGRCFTVCEDAATNSEEVLDLLRQGRVHAEGKSQKLGGRLSISLVNALKRVVRGGAEV